MIFKRKMYNKLLAWKQQAAGTKALLIEGARRIGKSTLVEEFAKNEYRSYLLMDFNKVSDSVTSAFNNYMNDLDTFFLILSSEYGVKLYPKESIIIFDEIQQFPKARQAIKYLVADGRFDYIETGSLISIKENVQDITIPSEERTQLMYPMDFEEFAWAMNEEPLITYIRQCFDKKEPLEQGLHAKAMLLFRQYMIVGGMPKSLLAYLENNRSFEMADVEKRDILTLYRNDIMKIRSGYRSNVLSIFDQIPAFLSRSERRVVMNRIEKGASFPKYHDTFFWLSDSMIANECFNCSDPNVGLSLNEDRTYVKCYMGDTGLLVTQIMKNRDSIDEDLYKALIIDNLGINQGMIVENIVAQMLRAAGHELYFHEYLYVPEGTTREKKYEIDFMIVKKKKICPIEVKSSNYMSHKSFDYLLQKYQLKCENRFIIYTKDLKYQDGIMYIPIYMTMLL